MKPKRPFDLDAVRQRLAACGIHPDHEPSVFQHSADIIGLTPAGLGYERCGYTLNKLRREAGLATDGYFALSVVRDPRTHERLGYRVHADDQMIADQIAETIRRVLP
jgi:hypothetical protein